MNIVRVLAESENEECQKKASQIINEIIITDDKIGNALKALLLEEQGPVFPAVLFTLIENLRVTNNTNWMHLLRLAYNESREVTKTLLSSIHANDQEVSKLMNNLLAQMQEEEELDD